MATSVTMLADELAMQVRWQRTPQAMTHEDYINAVKYGLRQLFIDTQRASVYNTDLYYEEDEELFFNKNLNINEQEYVLLCAQINFMKQVAADVNNIVGYTTDALTVTNADKPYANIKDSVEKLENERRIKYYKMVDYTMLTE